MALIDTFLTSIMRHLDLSPVGAAARPMLHALCVGLALATEGAAQRVLTLGESGDPLPGGGQLSSAPEPGFTVASDGRWALCVGDGLGGQVLLVDGALHLASGDVLSPANGVTFGGEVRVHLAQGGEVFLAHPTGTVPGTASLPPSYGLFRGGELVLESRVGATVTPAPFAAPVTVEGLTLHAVTDGGRMLAGLLLVEAGTGARHHALAVVDSTPGGQLSGVALVGWTGDPWMPGVGMALDTLFGSPRIDAAGRVAWHARGAGVDHVFVDGLPVASEGGPSPVAGVTYGLFDETVPVSVAAGGAWAARVTLQTGERVLAGVGGAGLQVLRREGAPLATAGGAAVQFTGFEDGAWTTAAGQIVWRGEWTEPSAPVEALFVDDELLVRTGDRTDRGESIAALRDLVVAPGGRFVVVRARVGAPERDAWLRVEVPLGERYGAANPCSTGVAARLTAYGDPEVVANDLGLAAEGLPAASFGVPLAGRARGATPLPGGSQGVLLVAPPIALLGDRVVRADVHGRAYTALDLTRPMLGAAPAAGETWHFQLWFRDAHPVATTNTTAGASVTLR